MNIHAAVTMINYTVLSLGSEDDACSLENIVTFVFYKVEGVYFEVISINYTFIISLPILAIKSMRH